jgi:hypothetical protein
MRSPWQEGASIAAGAFSSPLADFCETGVFGSALKADFMLREASRTGLMLLSFAT